MIKFLYFLLLVVATQAFVTGEVQDTQKSIPRPRFNDNHPFRVRDTIRGLTVSWDAVPNNTEDPVLGYKLIVTEEIAPNTFQFRSFQDIVVNGVDQTIAAVAERREGLWYFLQVQAFTENALGPLSERWGFRVGDPNNVERTPTYTFMKMEEEAKE